MDGDVIATGPACDLTWALNHVCETGRWYAVKIEDGAYTITEDRHG